jgi:hypothetical protein
VESKRILSSRAKSPLVFLCFPLYAEYIINDGACLS